MTDAWLRELAWPTTSINFFVASPGRSEPRPAGWNGLGARAASRCPAATAEAIIEVCLERRDHPLGGISPPPMVGRGRRARALTGHGGNAPVGRAAWPRRCAYAWRQTLKDERRRMAARIGKRTCVGTMPRSWPPRKVPATEPAAMTRRNLRSSRITAKLWSRL